MLGHYQDSMAMVSQLGAPGEFRYCYSGLAAINRCLDIFVTMTINPNDPDIKENLPKGVPAHYMPHLVTRVAYLKFKRLMDDVVKECMICM